MYIQEECLYSNIQLPHVSFYLLFSPSLSSSISLSVVNPNPPVSADSLPSDFFSVFFHCQDHPHPWQALLAYCIALERPLLSLLAGCYKVHV